MCFLSIIVHVKLHAYKYGLLECKLSQFSVQMIPPASVHPRYMYIWYVTLRTKLKYFPKL